MPAELREVLDKLPRVSTHVLTNPQGRPWRSSKSFQNAWSRTIAAAGLEDLQNRDLKRTAMVRMAELGGTSIQIAAISGNAIEDTERILETYIPRTAEMAKEMVRIVDRAYTVARGPTRPRAERMVAGVGKPDPKSGNMNVCSRPFR